MLVLGKRAPMEAPQSTVEVTLTEAGTNDARKRQDFYENPIESYSDMIGIMYPCRFGQAMKAISL